MDYIVPAIICVLFYMFSYKIPPFQDCFWTIETTVFGKKKNCIYIIWG